MKKVLLLFTLFSTTWSLQAQSIVEYYNLLKNYDQDIQHYALNTNSSKRPAAALVQSKMQQKIDTKNDFIEIKDQKTEDQFTLQMGKVKTKHNKDLLLVTKTHLNEFTHGELHCLEYRNGRWSEFTHLVFPELSYLDFMGNRAGKKVEDKMSLYFEYKYNILQGGNLVEVELIQDVLNQHCAKGKLDKKSCSISKEISYKKVLLKWNKEKEKFDIEKRVK